ncbi:hypothetical protein K505DRAFT_351205 [Melanomma pulvis-pyrius CBS 109.77]|uniref:REJ domain-containing protein n=1 Tax=Melanomma pulvis-pyrius CBS 109.77 TaxID=1314802 RepID=A0A6A6X6J6_9PLEO|nr:hypothetical protein K505DRAFT_351205 [Melanomma pulvis-pyrius CBS 109.77]
MAPPSSASLPSRHQRSEESWIEIGSRPSSSSLSSAADEIITTGLRVQHFSNTRQRRRRAVRMDQFQVGTGHHIRGGGNSSQEEYDESESESDRVMTSSAEGIGPSPLQDELRRASRNPHSVASSETMSEREGDDEEEDDDENATAVNYPRSTRRQFEPRPNAFSHPPTEHATQMEPGGASSIPRRPVARPSSQRHSFPQHSSYNAVSPNSRPDHDEALRASLSTLLSAAAAVRGLPKPGQARISLSNPSTRVDPTSLRLVPESVALGGIAEDTNSAHVSSHVSLSASPSASSPTSSDKPKRKASPPINANIRSNSKDRRAVKKPRRIGPLVEEVSPTLLTWVVSAGVVVLVSALSFSAGYVVGKEAGQAEAMGKMGAVGSEAGRCGKEATSGMGLRRLRWSGPGAVVRV